MPATQPIETARAPGATAAVSIPKSAAGLTGGEALRLVKQFGPNSMPDESLHPARRAIEKFWAPVPWMLEAAIVLQLVLGISIIFAFMLNLLKTPVFEWLQIASRPGIPFTLQRKDQ